VREHRASPNHRNCWEAAMAEADPTTAVVPLQTPLNVTALAKRFGVARTTIQRPLKKGCVLPPRKPRAALPAASVLRDAAAARSDAVRAPHCDGRRVGLSVRLLRRHWHDSDIRCGRAADYGHGRRARSARLAQEAQDGFLTRAHLQHEAAAQEAVVRDAAPITQRIALAEALDPLAVLLTLAATRP
jgi:hypothetical protein